ncbi:TAXI family TRAP transporter solute-binding subunit [Streptomyces sp. NPDC091287]|uniref:TAXI family TRAP transporter solute-binding subunit n=1 Tax=Streptomyces sp. NPDC091287 TaxID=3365988 RepID=UPI00381A9395
MTTEPRLDRPVTLHFRGDWGQANMHRMCGWIAQEIGDRAPEGSQFAIWSGRGGRDTIAALQAREADVAVLTPTAAVRMLHRAGELEGLAALGVVGQRDRLVVAVDASLPVATVADLAQADRPLRITTSPDDGVNLIGLAAYRALRLAGVDTDRHAFSYYERPFPAIARFADGEADVLIHEAIMTPHWQRIDRVRPVRYLPWGDAVLDGFEAEGWGRAVVPAGYLPGLAEDLTTLDFSDFAVLCHEDLADDVAYLATWCMVQTRRALEVQYAHIPPDRSPVTYPLVPADMARTPLPLHPAAAKAYDDLAGAQLPDDAPIWS